MAAKSTAVTPKKGKPIKGLGRKGRRQQYKLTERWRTNKKRRMAAHSRHLLLAKARRARNHRDVASPEDFKALASLQKGA